MKKTLLAFTLVAVFAACKKSPVQEPIMIDPVEVENTNFYVSKIKEENNPYMPVPNATYNYLGCGYDITGRYVDNSSVRTPVIDVNKVSTIYPSRIVKWAINSSSSPISRFGENAEVLSLNLSASIKATRTLKAFRKTLTSLPDSALSKRYIYAVAMSPITLDRVNLNLPIVSAFSNVFSDSFLADVSSLAPAELVQKYGTHVLENIYLGEKLEIIYQAESSKTRADDRIEKAEIGYSRGATACLNLFTGIYYSGPAYINTNKNQRLFYKTFGGDPATLPQLPQDKALNPKMDFTNWRHSSTRANATMIDIDENGLIPLQNFIFDPIRKAAVEAYINQYIQDNSVRLID